MMTLTIRPCGARLLMCTLTRGCTGDRGYTASHLQDGLVIHVVGDGQVGHDPLHGEGLGIAPQGPRPQATPAPTAQVCQPAQRHPVPGSAAGAATECLPRPLYPVGALYLRGLLRHSRCCDAVSWPKSAPNMTSLPACCSCVPALDCLVTSTMVPPPLPPLDFVDGADASRVLQHDTTTPHPCRRPFMLQVARPHVGRSDSQVAGTQLRPAFCCSLPTPFLRHRGGLTWRRAGSRCTACSRRRRKRSCRSARPSSGRGSPPP